MGYLLNLALYSLTRRLSYSPPLLLWHGLASRISMNKGLPKLSILAGGFGLLLLVWGLALR